MLKLIGLVSMIIDHFGITFFPSCIIFRIFGRIAFPIFAYQVSVSYNFTSNKSNYLKRLILFGAIAQFPYMFLFSSMNILLTFATSVIAMSGIDFVTHRVSCIRESFRKTLIFCVTIITFAIVFEAFKFEYGAYGFLSVLLFRYLPLKDNFQKVLILFSVMTMAFCFYSGFWVQIFSPITLIIIKALDSYRVKHNKYFFYVFYPLHLTVFVSVKFVTHLF